MPLSAAAATSSSTNNSEPTSNPNGAFDVVVSPSSQDLEVKPGETVTAKIQIRNEGLATEHIKVTLMKFGAAGANGTPQLNKLGPNDEFAQWASFSTTHFDAQPNVWTPITMTIAPPANAAFGYYYAVIFSRDNPKPSGTTGSNLLGSVASLVLLDVQAPGAVRHADIVNFSTSRNVYEFLPASFTVRMHNTGNVHVAPRGNIFVSKGGKNLAILEVNLNEGNVLPKSYRVFTANWADGRPVYKEKVSNGKVVLDKAGKPVMNLDWSNYNMSKLRFGKYHAKLVMVYNNGSGDVEDIAQLNFWVIPWRILIIGLLTLALVIAGIWAVIIRPLRGRLKGNRSTVRLR